MLQEITHSICVLPVSSDYAITVEQKHQLVLSQTEHAWFEVPITATPGATPRQNFQVCHDNTFFVFVFTTSHTRKIP